MWQNSPTFSRKRGKVPMVGRLEHEDHGTARLARTLLTGHHAALIRIPCPVPTFSQPQRGSRQAPRSVPESVAQPIPPATSRSA